MNRAPAARPVSTRSGRAPAKADVLPSPDLPSSSAAVVSAPIFWVTVLLIFTHFARPFDTFLNGFKLPAIICGLGILAALVSGALRQLTTPIGVTLLCLIGWMALAVPSSFWMGGSFLYVLSFLRLWLIVMLMVGVAAQTPKDFVKLAGVLVFSCAFHLIVNGGEAGGRYALSGTFGNSDDVALLAGFAIPFWVLVAGRVRSAAIRYFLLAGGCGYLLILIGRTATRAAIPALLAMLAVYFFRGSGARKAAVITFAIFGSVTALFVLPQTAIDRFASLVNVFGRQNNLNVEKNEADASLVERKELLQDGMTIVLTHPLFGIGPGEFVDYRFKEMRRASGSTKPYLPTHNTYLEIATGGGLPALFFYLAFLFSIYMAIRRSAKANRNRANPDELVSQVCICAEAALIYFAVCAAFMTCDKHVHQFFVAGVAIALARLTSAAEVQPVQIPQAEPSMALVHAPQFNRQKRASSPTRTRATASGRAKARDRATARAGLV